MCSSSNSTGSSQNCRVAGAESFNEGEAICGIPEGQQRGQLFSSALPGQDPVDAPIIRQHISISLKTFSSIPLLEKSWFRWLQRLRPARREKHSSAVPRQKVLFALPALCPRPPQKPGGGSSDFASTGL